MSRLLSPGFFWQSEEIVVASGGTITEATINGNLMRIHTFTSNGNFELFVDKTVEYFIIAGGGGGGAVGLGGGSDGGDGIVVIRYLI